jgi:hypothetical protein
VSRLRWPALDEQREVGAPVAGDDAVGAAGLDLGDEGREVRDLADGVQVLSDDLHVGPLARHVVAEVAVDLLAVRVVLVDQVDVLDVGLILHEAGQRLHLLRGVGVEAEVPVRAALVGERRVDRGVVEVDELLARVALVVLLHRIEDGRRRARAVALRDVADALVDGDLQRVQALLGQNLVVEGDDLELHARGVLGAELLGHELPALELVLSRRWRADPTTGP